MTHLHVEQQYYKGCHVRGAQLMKCVMCHFKNISTSFQSSTTSRKGFITYNPEHGIMAMKKHVANEHNLNLQKYLLHMNFVVKGKDGGKWQKCKHKVIVTPTSIVNVFGNVRPY